MRNVMTIVQIGFTYIGTMVGAGFASGQEILQFFTRYGRLSLFTILISCFLFVWLGTKMMLLAHYTGAKSHEDLNCILFGEKAGQCVSAFMAFVLFGTIAVMLAGAGSIFREHLHLSYQLGLLMTLFISYLVLARGLEAILAVNTVIVPLMILFTMITLWACLKQGSPGFWPPVPTTTPSWKMWLSPFLYTALNLALAQAVLVPIGAAVRDARILRSAGWVGGMGMGLLLLAAHLSLSTHMPDIARFEIPNAFLIHKLGPMMQYLFLLVIYSEILTTLIADAFGLIKQARRYFGFRERTLIVLILAAGYLISHVGFSTLVGLLYPLFGLVSLGWLILMMVRRLA